MLKVASARQEKAGVADGLSSHFFRQGGAQHANAEASLSPQSKLDETQAYLPWLALMLTQDLEFNTVIAQLIGANKALAARVTEIESQKSGVGDSGIAMVSSESDVPSPASASMADQAKQ
ncbi:hypothetical protein ON010_g17721 [Phytophthora cinnamomi]|nr:hypothetical protein ON010_g17721 [Phytophthora cinnamomi]